MSRIVSLVKGRHKFFLVTYVMVMIRAPENFLFRWSYNYPLFFDFIYFFVFFFLFLWNIENWVYNCMSHIMVWICSYLLTSGFCTIVGAFLDIIWRDVFYINKKFVLDNMENCLFHFKIERIQALVDSRPVSIKKIFTI